MRESVTARRGRAHRTTATLLATGRTTWPELVVVAGLLVALAAVMLGPRIAHGNFSNDDWSYAVLAKYPGPGGALEAFDYLSFRPLMVLWFPATFGVLGTGAGVNLALLAATCVVEALLLYAVVRQLGAERVFAAALAALALIMPLRDSTRVWVCMDANVAAVALWLGGTLVALAAFRRRGRHAAILHATAGLLWLASIALYEIAAAAILATAGLLVLREGRRALLPSGLQAAAVGLFLALVTSGTFYTPLRGRALVDHGVVVGKEAPRALADAIWAPGTPSRGAAALACLVIAFVLAFGAAQVRRGSLSPSADEVVRRWLRLALVAIAIVVAGWTMVVPSSFLSPMLPGQFNRGNIVAGPALVLLIIAAAVIGAVVIADRRARTTLVAPALALLVLAVVGVGYVTQLRRDVRTWNRASAEQREIIQVIDARVPKLPPGATVITANAPDTVAPGVPVFAAPWDLAGALTLQRHDSSLRAYPYVPESHVLCGRKAIVLHNSNDEFGPQEGQYGATWFVDVGGRRADRIEDKVACEGA
jgi:hypothetical protein